jgi:phosphoglycerate dehydrogenase-like enzyme
MINSRAISKMKAGVVLINTARGGLVNEHDLAAALKYGEIRYAGLDVYQHEPPVGSPLLTAENVLLTPHIGAQTFENMERIGGIVCGIIGDFRKANPKL